MFKLAIAIAALCALAANGAWAQDKQAREVKTSQQSKMKKCNAEAKGMRGKERKEFMSGCLKA
jgi:hypothetical protein